MVFAHLVHSQLEPLLEFLCSLPGPTGKPALEFVMAEWMSRQHLFYGQYEGKVRWDPQILLCELPSPPCHWALAVGKGSWLRWEQCVCQCWAELLLPVLSVLLRRAVVTGASSYLPRQCSCCLVLLCWNRDTRGKGVSPANTGLLLELSFCECDEKSFHTCNCLCRLL